MRVKKKITHLRDKPRRRAGCIFARDKIPSWKQASRYICLDRRPWTVRHFWQRKDIVGENQTKTNIVIEVIWVVPVANRATGVVSIVVPRTATQNTRSHGLSHHPTKLTSSNLLANGLFQQVFSKHAHTD